MVVVIPSHSLLFSIAKKYIRNNAKPKPKKDQKKTYIIPHEHAIGELQHAHPNQESEEAVEQFYPLGRRGQVLPPEGFEDLLR